MTTALLPDMTALAHALVDPDNPLAESIVAELLASGVSVQHLCALFLAPAARQLGVWWGTDELTFSQVTLATTRIQTMLRNLPESRKPTSVKEGKGALFVSIPGEDHTLGVVMAADHFRRLGWDVGLLIGMDNAEARARILDDDRPVVGLSCTSAKAVDNLRRLVEDLRFRRPGLAIVLAGGMAHDAAVLQSLPAFDGVVDDLEGSERVMRGAIRVARSRA